MHGNRSIILIVDYGGTGCRQSGTALYEALNLSERFSWLDGDTRGGAAISISM